MNEREECEIGAKVQKDGTFCPLCIGKESVMLWLPWDMPKQGEWARSWSSAPVVAPVRPGGIH
jgi:hypothetical protein